MATLHIKYVYVKGFYYNYRLLIAYGPLLSTYEDRGQMATLHTPFVLGRSHGDIAYIFSFDKQHT